MKLRDLKKQDPYKAPEGYLEALPNKLMERIAEEAPEKPKGKGRFFSPQLQWTAGVAVAVTAILLAASFFWQTETLSKNEQVITWASLSKEEIHAYLLLEGVAGEEILELAGNDLDLEAKPAGLEITPELMEEVMDLEGIEEYL